MHQERPERVRLDRPRVGQMQPVAGRAPADAVRHDGAALGTRHECSDARDERAWQELVVVVELGEPRRSHEPPPCEQCCRQIGLLEHECLHPGVRVEVGGERRVDGWTVEHDQRCRPHALLCENALQRAAQQGRPLERSPASA